MGTTFAHRHCGVYRDSGGILMQQNRFRIVVALLGLLVSGCESSASLETDEPFDEWSIDDVWHQAKLRGVAFRAVGQEPGWLLEMTDGVEIVLLTNYGESRDSYPYVEPQVDQAARRTLFLLNEHDLVIEIRGESCVDTMSGENFSTTVTITLAASVLRGCGRALY
jgi:uncharacterized membrane protein